MPLRIRAPSWAIAAGVFAGCGAGCGVGCGGGGDGGPAPAAPDAEVVPSGDATAPPDAAAPVDAVPDAAAGADTAAASDTAVVTPDGTAPGIDATPDTAEPRPDTGPSPVEPSVPTTRDALYTWLAAGRYKTFAHESTPHSSAGPHGAPVLVFVNEKLRASLAAGSGEHPQGAAAIKELHSGGAVDGWAVAVKAEASSAGGAGWYWFEIYGSKDPSDALEGRGLPGCTGCHSLGHDYIRTPYPLR
ncbi:MAG: hypothetical protein HYV09_27365 [Deltaproteobacteria bacterium]|nr:hypothetical protein [Deltaproteobacteria bacterium]